jgi:hypothetical protein
MAIIMSVNSITVPNIDDSAISFGGVSPLNRFPPVREYIDTFEFSASFEADEEEPIGTTYTVTSISLSPIINGITSTFSENLINISGAVSNVFSNKYYQFKMNDGSIQTLSPYSASDFYGVIKYQPDFSRYAEITYTIQLSTGVGSPTIPFIAKQTVNNDWNTDRLILKNLVLQGGH